MQALKCLVEGETLRLTTNEPSAHIKNNESGQYIKIIYIHAHKPYMKLRFIFKMIGAVYLDDLYIVHT